MRGKYIFPDEVEIRSRGYLPHWEYPGAIISVTFRLADSLPLDVARRLAEERKRCRESRRDFGRVIEDSIRFERELDAELDHASGSCVLRDPACASVVMGALRFFDGQRYELFAGCVMPNHVHALLRLTTSHGLASVLHSWKSYTSNQINRLRGTRGRLWEPEYWDRIIRSEEDFRNVRDYILRNPEKAELKEWAWVWDAGRTP